MLYSISRDMIVVKGSHEQGYTVHMQRAWYSLGDKVLATVELFGERGREVVLKAFERRRIIDDAFL